MPRSLFLSGRGQYSLPISLSSSNVDYYCQKQSHTHNSPRNINSNLLLLVAKCLAVRNVSCSISVLSLVFAANKQSTFYIKPRDESLARTLMSGTGCLDSRRLSRKFITPQLYVQLSQFNSSFPTGLRNYHANYKTFHKCGEIPKLNFPTCSYFVSASHGNSPVN